ncbi:exosortase Y-associated Wzy-like protein [Pedobacter heparinus]|uniref:Transmembrane protein n=1 Tax=Pedobacter heparinus (strain ATCC 13125 / DSM 2366 / CIP 104194 / JCM 7457 / NBRC 12017 / NCIMB 9290 / NRRL B-14731 / HIM 762-3) TaxID=485917 RepID=C6XVM2_PEDHD|nr:hypothetical protein [Pedobacter heparinus]ACU06097.1 hypothetical protein Phep_3906 [Pedobacter heparinus DSM 2366]
MDNRTSIEQYLILFAPWVLASLLKDNAVLSYFIAWAGSFFIFYLTLTGKIKALPEDRNIAGQLMRPIFLVQFIFAGYMCCTTLFYFFDVLGYVDFRKMDGFYFADPEKLRLTAQCQRYYCLAHASFVTGILVFMRYPVVQKYSYNPAALTRLIFAIALITLSLSYLLLYIGGLSQFSHQLNTLSFIAGTLALAFAVPQRKTWSIIACLVIYGFNFYQALISGFKEPIILSILILGIFLYPAYKKTVATTFIPLLFMLFILLPTYNRVFRQHAWSDNVSADEASQLALESALNEEEVDTDNWSFFAYRLSEIDMFTKYVQSTPTHVNYYGFELVKQSLSSIIPRIFWPSKPITEQIVMERVYNAGVASRRSNVSAKPAFVVDAYLSAGTAGIFICLFIYGAVCQLIATKAEELFGGYVLGTALVFTGLFQVFWRGQSFEFLFNTVCWSYVTMYIIFWILRFTQILKPQ